jgi:hypothetical protein
VLSSVCASDTDVAGLKSLELLLRAQFIGHYCDRYEVVLVVWRFAD